jgi:hypothetical protein
MRIRRYYLAPLLVVGAATVTIAAATGIAGPTAAQPAGIATAPTAGGNHGGSYCGDFCGSASVPWIAPVSSGSRILPVVDASGHPIRQR